MKSYYPELDSMRGLAALTVFLSHALGIFLTNEVYVLLKYSPVGVMFDGAAAVDLFFVLSGFVLAKPYFDNEKNMNYLEFIVKRVFRIYPAFWFSLLVALIVRSLFSQETFVNNSAWSKSLWVTEVTPYIILEHIPLLWKTNWYAINPVIWSLIVEMRMAIILPILIVLVRRKSYELFSLSVALVLSLFVPVLSSFFNFILGLLVAKNYRNISEYFLNKPKVYAILLLGFSLVGYGNRALPVNFSEIHHSQISAVSSALLIFLVLNIKQVSFFLRAEVFKHFGQISFSFYLLHLPILILISIVLLPLKASGWIIILLAFISAYFLSKVLYVCVEKPFIEFGKKIVKKIS